MTNQGILNSGWIQTVSGGVFRFDAPALSDIRISDIGHALSNQGRFSGHTRRFLSVAEHSVNVSLHVPPADAAVGLMHDATEAYMGDMVQPLKQMIPRFREIEDAVWIVIADHFGLPHELPQSVKDADVAALMTERRDLMAPPPTPWSREVEPWPEPVEAWSPPEAYQHFMRRAAELGLCS
jgi:hypothetical protein